MKLIMVIVGFWIFSIPAMGERQAAENAIPDLSTESILTDPNAVSGNVAPAEEVVIPPADPEPECVKSTAFFYNDWLAFGKPACWCYPRNCRGDADGKAQYFGFGVHCYVFSNDLKILVSVWNIKEPPKGPGIMSIPNAICADFARDQQGSAVLGYVRVFSNDLNILLSYWNMKEIPKGPGIPDCMDTGDYNFFVNP